MLIILLTPFIPSLMSVGSLAHEPFNCDDDGLLPDTYFHLINKNKL